MSTRRKWLLRKWQMAAGNIDTAQKHLLDARAYYKQAGKQHLALVDANLTLLEQVKQFLIESRHKV